MKKILTKKNLLNKVAIKKINSILLKEKENYSAYFKNDFNFLGELDNNLVVGDIIFWIETNYVGKYPKVNFDGYNFFYGKIIKESYSERGQHTFTILFANGDKKLKKGRTLHKIEARVIKRADNFEELQQEKNKRGLYAKIKALENWIMEHDPSHFNYQDKVDRLEEYKIQL